MSNRPIYIYYSFKMLPQIVTIRLSCLSASPLYPPTPADSGVVIGEVKRMFLALSDAPDGLLYVRLKHDVASTSCKIMRKARCRFILTPHLVSSLGGCRCVSPKSLSMRVGRMCVEQYPIECGQSFSLNWPPPTTELFTFLSPRFFFFAFFSPDYGSSLYVAFSK